MLEYYLDECPYRIEEPADDSNDDESSTAAIISSQMIDQNSTSVDVKCENKSTASYSYGVLFLTIASLVFVWEVAVLCRERKSVGIGSTINLAFWMILAAMLVITSAPPLFDDYPQNWIHTLAAVSTN